MTDVALSSGRDLARKMAEARLSGSLRRLCARLDPLDAGSLDMILPNGAIIDFHGVKPGPHAVLDVKSPGFTRRLIAGDVGFAEGYIAGEWTTPSLVDLLQLFAANQALITRFESHPLLRAIQMARHWFNRNTRAGSRRNIHAHYDLGNAFYGRWLDPTMSYSSGLDVGEDLEAAQIRKYEAMAQAAGLKPGDRVLEIGCGWGGFAEHAARLGCKVTGLTISTEQHGYAVERMARAGLSDRVDIRLCDYRDVTGEFDAIVSIEMFEAVGERYWPVYFAQLHRLLRAGGRAALQIITIREDVFPRYRREMDFIRRYVFPGGMLPTPTLLRQLGHDAGLTLVGERAFGLDYAETCRHWRDRFEKAWTRIAPLGFDERFRRIWTYYLAYCEAGFRAGTIDVRQVAYEKPATTGA